MTAYIKLSTLEYPRHEGDIRNEHPEIREDQTWPDFPCPDTHAFVVETTPPAADFAKQETAAEIAPKQINGVWTQQWEVRRIPDDVYAKLLEMNQGAPNV